MMISVNHIVSRNFIRFRNFLLYGIIGTFCAIIDFCLFYFITTNYEVNYLVVNSLSVSVGISLSFLLNVKYNFKVKDRILFRFLIFILVGVAGLLMSSSLLFFFIEALSLEKSISKVLSIVFVVLLQFLLNRLITFKKAVV